MTVKTADSKGRVTLGAKYAYATLIYEETEGGVIILKPGAVVPQREAWLHNNKVASHLVDRGLWEARERKFSDNPPDLRAAADWIDALED